MKKVIIALLILAIISLFALASVASDNNKAETPCGIRQPNGTMQKCPPVDYHCEQFTGQEQEMCLGDQSYEQYLLDIEY